MERFPKWKGLNMRYKINSVLITVDEKGKVVEIAQKEFKIKPLKKKLFFIGCEIRPAFYSEIKKDNLQNYYLENTLNKYIINQKLEKFYLKNKNFFIQVLS